MKLIVLKNNVPINEVEVAIPDIEETYEIYVGRADDCHVLIDDPLISRHHFVLKNELYDWYCEKLSQLGIVQINGIVSSRTKINEGEEIRCGVYSLLVTDLPRPVRQEFVPPGPSTSDIQNQEYASPLVEEKETEVIREEVTTIETPAIDDYADLDHPEEVLADENGENVFDSGDSFEDSVLSVPDDFANEADSALDSFSSGDNDVERDEGTRFFRTFVNYQLVLFGEHAPYDRYQIDTDEVFIGRDTKKCQIILDDPEVSSMHALIKKNGNEIILEDLNSSNGTILNGERINKSPVNTGDEFIIGSTSFTLEVKSDLLDAESDRLMPVEQGQVIETEEIHEEEVLMDGAGEISFGADAPPEKSLIKRIWKNPEQRKKAIYGLVAVVMAWVFLAPEEKDLPPETEKKVSEGKVENTKGKDSKQGIKLTPEQEKQVGMNYELGVGYFEQSKYSEAQKEFEAVVKIHPEYKKVQTYLEQTKVALKRLEELDAQKRAEIERVEKKKKIEEILVKAREAVKERKVQVAESFFSQIIALDPENMEVGQLKLDLEVWQKEQERKALEEAAKIAARKKMVDQLAPGKTSYLKKEWYRAILKLEEFMRIKGMDEDLVKEGSEMLSDAKNQLASELGPLLGKARSLKEGQDYKNAYESFLEVLKLEPTNAEALNEVDEIKNQLETRSKRIYREAIISESLSLFTDAKEKFQEVQQTSPTDSEYYRKASDKLKNYME